MNIIFGDYVDTLPDHYIKLELDTFRIIDSNNTFTAYCLVKKLAPDEFATIDAYRKIHVDLLDAYRKQHWNYCEQAITGLMDTNAEAIFSDSTIFINTDFVVSICTSPVPASRRPEYL